MEEVGGTIVRTSAEIDPEAVSVGEIRRIGKNAKKHGVKIIVDGDSSKAGKITVTFEKETKAGPTKKG